jgi:hypothetical protein
MVLSASLVCMIIGAILVIISSFPVQSRVNLFQLGIGVFLLSFCLR